MRSTRLPLGAGEAADLADGTKQRLVMQGSPECVVEGPRSRGTLAVGGRDLGDGLLEGRVGIESERPRESRPELTPEPAARDLAMTRAPHETREAADVLEARARWPRVERDRRPEPPPAHEQVEETHNAGEKERAPRPGSHEENEHIACRVDAMVVLVEDYGAPARDRRTGERERESSVIGVAEISRERRGDRAHHDERPAALTSQRDDRPARGVRQRDPARTE